MKSIIYLLIFTILTSFLTINTAFARDKKLGTSGGYNTCDKNECYRYRIPLHESVKSANFEELKRLIASGEDVNERNFSGATALSLAILSNQHKVAEYLLQNGANPNYSVDLVEKLIQKGDVINLEKLFKAGLSVSGEEGNIVPLTIAIKENKKQIIDAIMKYNPDVNNKGKSRYDETPLHSSIYNKCRAIINLDRINHTLADYKKSPRHPQVKRSNEEKSKEQAEYAYWSSLVKLLIQRGANPNKVSSHGVTPLQVAAECHDVDSAKLLLSKKADVNTVDNFGRTPLLAAFSENSSEIVNEKYQLEFIKLLISHGADINYRNSKSSSANYVIHLATFSGTLDTLKYIISLKVDVNLQNEDGRPALYYANVLCDANKFETLMANGANPRIKDKSNEDTVYQVFNGRCDPNKMDSIKKILTKYKII